MKKKVTMTCVLKSGQKVKDSIKVDTKNARAVRAFNEMQQGIQDSLNYSEPAVRNFTFGTTTIAISEIAAITFKEN